MKKTAYRVPGAKKRTILKVGNCWYRTDGVIIKLVKIYNQDLVGYEVIVDAIGKHKIDYIYQISTQDLVSEVINRSDLWTPISQARATTCAKNWELL